MLTSLPIPRRIAAPSPILIAVLVCVLAPRAVHSHNGAIAGATSIHDISVDGDLSDWPSDLAWHPIAHSGFGDLPTDDHDLHGRYRVGYDANQHALYVAVEVADESHVVLDEDDGQWNSQDGCSIYIETKHTPGDHDVRQYFYCGKNLWPPVNDTYVNDAVVKMKTTAGNRVYEWKVPLPPNVPAGEPIGFDVDVTDKDADDSFTWTAWGPGTQKAYFPRRMGDLYLAASKRDLEIGTAHGRVALQGVDPTELNSPPLVEVQSLTHPRRWSEVACSASGQFEARLPAGEYAVRPVDSVTLRVSPSTTTLRLATSLCSTTSKQIPFEKRSKRI